MTNADTTGEPTRTPAAEESEQALLAAQVELIMAAPPLDMAVRFLAAALDDHERTLAQLPADTSAEELRRCWASCNLFLRHFLRGASWHTTNFTKLADRLALAAGLRFEWLD